MVVFLKTDIIGEVNGEWSATEIQCQSILFEGQHFLVKTPRMANLSHCQLVGDAKIGKDASQDEIGQNVDMRHWEEIEDNWNGYGMKLLE